MNWEQCTAAAVAGNPACREYAGLLATLARFYGGGDGSPLLVELSKFAKKYSEGRVLGEEFLSHVGSWKAPGAPEGCPRVRLAALACNLTSPKVVNGIAKLLPDKVLDKIARSSPEGLQKLEADLESMEAFLAGALGQKKINEDKRVDLYGLFQVRGIAHLAGCSKHTFDHTEFKSADEIITGIVEQTGVTKGCGLPKSWEALIAPTKKEPDAGSADPSGTSGALTAAELTDPKRILASKGFEPGAIVVKKGFEQQGRYRIEGIGAELTLCKFDFYQGFDPTNQSYKMDFQTFLKKWHLSKGDLPSWLPRAMVKKAVTFLPHQSSEDALRAGIFVALKRLHEDAVVDFKELGISRGPTGVHCLGALKANALVFVPYVGMANIKAAPPSTPLS